MEVELDVFKKVVELSFVAELVSKGPVVEEERLLDELVVGSLSVENSVETLLLGEMAVDALAAISSAEELAKWLWRLW